MQVNTNILTLLDAAHRIMSEEREKQHWTSRRSESYQRMKKKWITAWVHYEADINILRSEEHLIRRAQGESPGQYDERKKTSDYLPLFGTTVDSLVGRLLAIEPVAREFSRENFKEGLGKTDVVGTPAYNIWRDCDGSGTNWLTMIEDLAIRVLVFNAMWIYVKPQVKANGTEAQIRLIEPIQVVNEREVDGALSEVLVREVRDARTSIRDAFKEMEVYTLFTHEGYIEVFVSKDARGKTVFDERPIAPYGTNGFSFWRTSDKKKKQLPIFRCALPLRRYVGHILAEKNAVLFNQESERDNLLRVACTPLFIFVGNNKAFETAGENREKGHNALQLDPQASNKHYYAAPQTAPGELRTKVLRDKIADYFVSGFRFYEDSIRGKQKTATEIGQDAASGEGSILNTMGNTIDEAESNIGWLLYQCYFPDKPELWGQFSCSRPTDYTVASPREEADKIIEAVFGGEPLPIGNVGREKAIQAWAKAYRIDPALAEVKTDVREWALAVMANLRDNPEPPVQPDTGPAEPAAEEPAEELVEEEQA